eukprot:5899899-Amphidinium_carterae.1
MIALGMMNALTIVIEHLIDPERLKGGFHRTAQGRVHRHDLRVSTTKQIQETECAGAAAAACRIYASDLAAAANACRIYATPPSPIEVFTPPNNVTFERTWAQVFAAAGQADGIGDDGEIVAIVTPPLPFTPVPAVAPGSATGMRVRSLRSHLFPSPPTTRITFAEFTELPALSSALDPSSVPTPGLHKQTPSSLPTLGLRLQTPSISTLRVCSTLAQSDIASTTAEPESIQGPVKVEDESVASDTNALATPLPPSPLAVCDPHSLDVTRGRCDGEG